MRFTRHAAATMCTMLAMTVAQAGLAQTVVSAPGAPFTTTALSGFTTSGAAMAGTQVTGYTVGGGVAAGTWADLGGGFWGVSNSAFTLRFPTGGDTFSNSWNLIVNGGAGLFRLVIAGAPGNTVFDRATPSPGTDGSANGFDFAWVGTTDLWSTTATYMNSVGIGAAAPVGDIFATVDVAFGTAVTTAAGTLAFRMDSDNAAVGATIVPDPRAIVPEPSTVILLASGLAAIGALARRRRA